MGSLLLTGADEHVTGEEDASTAQLLRIHYNLNDTLSHVGNSNMIQQSVMASFKQNVPGQL